MMFELIYFGKVLLVAISITIAIIAVALLSYMAYYFANKFK